MNKENGPAGAEGADAAKNQSRDQNPTRWITGGQSDPFGNLDQLRLSQDFAARVGVKKLLTTVPVRKPNRQEFIRVHPDPAYRLDTAFDGGDIDPFFLALGAPEAYAARFPICNILNGDMNGDGFFNGADTDPFFACLGGGCP